MTDTLVAMEPSKDEAPEGAPFGVPADAGLSPEELAAIAGLVRKAREQGVAVTGPGGLLKALTKTVIETALEEETVDHLGYDKHDPAGRNRANSRNGRRPKRWSPTTAARSRSRSPGIGRAARTAADGPAATAVVRLGPAGDQPVRERAADRGDLRPPARGVRSLGVEGHDLEDHRQDRRGDDLVVGVATGPGAVSTGRRATARHRLHRPEPDPLLGCRHHRWKRPSKALDAVVQAGKVRYLGASSLWKTLVAITSASPPRHSRRSSSRSCQPACGLAADPAARGTIASQATPAATLANWDACR